MSGPVVINQPEDNRPDNTNTSPIIGIIVIVVVLIVLWLLFFSGGGTPAPGPGAS